jgi:hypothetical protein
MRRLSGVVLILLFWLGPLLSLLPDNAESRLPACCRRGGVHHCAMSLDNGPGSGTSSPVFRGPEHCPAFPSGMAASTTPLHALAVACAHEPAPTIVTLPAFGNEATLCSAVLYSRFNRGPPASRHA